MSGNDGQIINDSIYLGDGVYMHADDVCVTLLTWDGVKITNRVHLDQRVLDEFTRQLERRQQGDE